MVLFHIQCIKSVLSEVNSSPQSKVMRVGWKKKRNISALHFVIIDTLALSSALFAIELKSVMINLLCISSSVAALVH